MKQLGEPLRVLGIGQLWVPLGPSPSHWPCFGDDAGVRKNAVRAEARHPRRASASRPAQGHCCCDDGIVPGNGRALPGLSHYYVARCWPQTSRGHQVTAVISASGVKTLDSGAFFCSWLQLGMQALESPLFVSTYPIPTPSRRASRGTCLSFQCLWPAHSWHPGRHLGRGPRRPRT